MTTTYENESDLLESFLDEDDDTNANVLAGIIARRVLQDF